MMRSEGEARRPNHERLSNLLRNASSGCYAKQKNIDRGSRKHRMIDRRNQAIITTPCSPLVLSNKISFYFALYRRYVKLEIHVTVDESTNKEPQQGSLHIKWMFSLTFCKYFCSNRIWISNHLSGILENLTTCDEIYNNRGWRGAINIDFLLISSICLSKQK